MKIEICELCFRSEKPCICKEMECHPMCTGSVGKIYHNRNCPNYVVTNGWRSVEDKFPTKSDYYLVKYKVNNKHGYTRMYWNFTTMAWDCGNFIVTHWTNEPDL